MRCSASAPILTCPVPAVGGAVQLNAGCDLSPYFAKDPKSGRVTSLRADKLVDKLSGPTSAAAAVAATLATRPGEAAAHPEREEGRQGLRPDLDALADGSALYRNTAETAEAAAAARARAANLEDTQGGRGRRKDNRAGALLPHAPPTSGKDHFNLPGTELTEQVRHDLRAVRMRGALDPKRFYKSHDYNASRFVQVGTVIEGREEYTTARLSKKERRSIWWKK